jgi:HNH endonuclease
MTVSEGAAGPERAAPIVKAVRGRHSPGSPRGLPVVASMTIQTPAGELEIRLPTPPGESWSGRLRAIVDRAIHSPGCAICLAPEATSGEHVPQRGLGGKVMMRTCPSCNNKLGSRVEAELQAHYDRARCDVRISVPGVPGSRRMPNILVRETADGTPVHIFDTGRIDTEIDEGLRRLASQGGHFDITYRDPDPAAIKIAGLKHAYLAACLAIRGVPDTPRARAIRDELVAARDQPRGMPLPLGPIAEATEVRITGMEPVEQSILIVDWMHASGKTLTEVVLAGTISVTWPFESELLSIVDEVSAARDAGIERARQAAASGRGPTVDQGETVTE